MPKRTIKQGTMRRGGEKEPTRRRKEAPPAEEKEIVYIPENCSSTTGAKTTLDNQFNKRGVARECSENAVRV